MPAPRYTLATAVLSAILICSPSFAKGRECIDWPKLMSRYRSAELPQAPSVSVKAFSNYTGKPGDGWLSFGISDLISDMLSSGRSLRSPSGPAAARDDARLRLARTPRLEGESGEALRLLLYLFERDDAVKLMRAG